MHTPMPTPNLAILIGDRDVNLARVIMRALEHSTRRMPLTEMMSHDNPEKLVEAAFKFKAAGVRVVVTTGYLYDRSLYTGEFVVRSCAQRGIPVGLISGAIHDDASFRETKQIADCFLQKPFTPTELIRFVYDILVIKDAASRVSA